MLVYAPLGVALLHAGEPELAIVGEAGMLTLATLPDSDHRLPFVRHRGVTHTFGFALLVGLALGGVGWWLDGRPATTASGLAVFGFVIGVLSILAHLLGDVLTPAGIRPFWPLWDGSVTLSVTPSKSLVANYGLFLLGVGVTVALFVVAPTTTVG